MFYHQSAAATRHSYQISSHGTGRPGLELRTATKLSSAGFEPTAALTFGLRVRRLNHSATRSLDTLSHIIDKHAPLREKPVSERFCSWITPELQKICRTRDKLKIAAVKSNSELLMSAYKHMRCKANNLNQSLKTQYFTNKIRSCEGNIKETWKTMNQVINKGSKTTKIKALKEGDETTNEDKSIADTMNSFFCNVGKILAEKIAPKPETFGLELCSSSSELFQHNSVSWMYALYNNLNADNVMYHSFELETSNRFSVLSNMLIISSIDSYFSPTTFSSPRKRILLSSSSSSA